jgi:hypothetical protein
VIRRALLCAIVAALAGCPAASADVFGPISLVSQGSLDGGPSQQALYAHDAVISGNGLYVAFDGFFGGESGVWRRDLQTGEVQPVAVGVQEGENGPCAPGAFSAPSACDAMLPSISADGQQVSFTTAAPLAPGDDSNIAPDVYVRDMELPESAQRTAACEQAEASPQPSAQDCPYTVVSALDASAQSLSYNAPRSYGSVAAGRTALSADGQEVAFVTTAPSNLTGPAGEETTPALQVAVRDLADRHTELVSVQDEPATGVPIEGRPVGELGGRFGAVYAGGTPPQFPYTSRAYKPVPAVGASISADGSTVAWLATNVGDQARMLGAESVQPEYAEPLWRRVADGPGARVRRVTGGSEPENPACAASGQTSLPPGEASEANPCQGPFEIESQNIGVLSVEDTEDAIPQLSADGSEVAFLASAKPVALGTDFGVSGNRRDDLYVASMRPGERRTTALNAITRLAGANVSELTADAPIIDFALSPDGRALAFTTERAEFPLPTFNYVTAPEAVAGLGELFEADLEDDTLTRVTQGFLGGPSEHPFKKAVSGSEDYPLEDGALSPSFSDDGLALAFSSTASNLVYGDGNTPPAGESFFDGSDAFVVQRQVFAREPAAVYISPPPPGPATIPAWRLGVTARSLPDGEVRLYVQTPGAGSLRIGAAAQLVRRTGKRSRHGRGTRASLVNATVATATRRSSTAALVTVTLALPSSQAALARRAGGLPASATVAFSATGHATLRARHPVVFHRTLRSAKKKEKKGG